MEFLRCKLLANDGTDAICLVAIDKIVAVLPSEKHPGNVAIFIQGMGSDSLVAEANMAMIEDRISEVGTVRDL